MKDNSKRLSLVLIVAGLLYILLTMALLHRSFFFAPRIRPSSFSAAPLSSPTVPFESSQAYGRLDVEFLSVPSSQLEALRNLFDTTKVSDLSTFLMKAGGKIFASTSTGVRSGQEPVTLQVGGGQFTIAPQKIAPDQLSVNGAYTGAFSCPFTSLLQPGYYQLLMANDQSMQTSSAHSFNVIVTRIQEVHWTKNATPQSSEDFTAISSGLVDRPRSQEAKRVVYVNPGNNTTGFIVKSAEPNFTVIRNTLVANAEGHHGRDDDTGWFALPASVTGDFQIDFDVFPDAKDAASWVVLFDNTSNCGIVVSNSTETSFGTHSLDINSMEDVTDYNQFFFRHATLANSETGKFSDHTWTHIRIIKKGNRLSDDVGGQIISTDLSNANFPQVARVGLGYYATKNLGGNGQFGYANIRIVEL